ncbi:MAG TPA: hypothetical protein VJT73_03020 [Polyangiaceae bacterium]|nr:hypothetical protein [Polyangiaceae bacterium]
MVDGHDDEIGSPSGEIGVLFFVAEGDIDDTQTGPGVKYAQYRGDAVTNGWIQ